MKEERIKNMRMFEAHVTEDSDKELKEEAKKDEGSSEEYGLISALTGSVSPRNDTWLVDSGTSNHMSGYKELLSCLEEKESLHKVILVDDSQYPIKRRREASLKMDYGNPMKMKDVLYVPGLKNNLLFIYP